MTPVFYYDLASPWCYLAAERLMAVLGGRVEWVPAELRLMPEAERFESFRCAEEESSFREDVGLRARALSIQQIRWPEPFPFDSTAAMRTASFAEGIGKGVAFAIAAFRQAFAGGHALNEDFVLIAAAACEMHPTAVLRAIELRSVKQRLQDTTAAALAAGASDLPALVIEGEVFVGERMVERAAARAAAAGMALGATGAAAE